MAGGEVSPLYISPKGCFFSLQQGSIKAHSSLTSVPDLRVAGFSDWQSLCFFFQFSVRRLFMTGDFDMCPIILEGCRFIFCLSWCPWLKRLSFLVPLSLYMWILLLCQSLMTLWLEGHLKPRQLQAERKFKGADWDTAWRWIYTFLLRFCFMIRIFRGFKLQLHWHWHALSQVDFELFCQRSRSRIDSWL